jgi:hypothetical protein
MGGAIRKQGYEKWECESDVGELCRGPIGKEANVPVGALDVRVDGGYETVAPRWSFRTGCVGGDAEYAVGVEQVKQRRQQWDYGVEAGTEDNAWAWEGRRTKKGVNY